MIPQTISHYRILHKIGAGGMGEVYLAEDIRLKRKVALKLLSKESTQDPDRVRRFEQEARAASALNHPNILMIFEIGQRGSTHYIATEFIEGETLRKRLAKSRMSVREVLDASIQIASALAAAHDLGIIHRDIKPENIMLRPDGYIKVLDFGLAKLMQQQSSPIDLQGSTILSPNTEPGTVMGTVAYMSPEQVRALVVDERSDIFSLGVVIYEMVAGCAPFSGETASDLIASILTFEPAPLDHYSRDVPAELRRIVSKALRKNRDDRYQTSRDLLVDLRQLKEHIEFEARLERSASPEVRDRSTATAEERFTKQQYRAGWRSFFFSHRLSFVILAVLLAIGVGASIYTWRLKRTAAPSQPEIKTLAVLPLKSLDAGQNYLGLGIADAVIRRISQTGDVIVRPTSAVRRYLSEETDALAAARQLNVDAVLEGTVQRADDRLRVSVNLLRVSDNASLWAQYFDTRMADIFTIQDTMSQQVAAGLRLQLSAPQQARLTKRSTSNPIAYEFYLKGLYNFDQRISDSRPQMELTIDFFKKAIEADPDFALAHAQLAYAYASMAVFLDPTEPAWAERAREEINRAQALDSQLAETHLARFQMLFSQYEGYKADVAARELLLAQQLNPNIGHAELGYLYTHLGLEDLAERELKRALDTDPTSEFAKGEILNLYQLGAKYDEWLSAYQKLYPDNSTNDLDHRDGAVWYFLGKGRLDEAQKALEDWEVQAPNDIKLPHQKALLFALKGDFRSAEAEIRTTLSRHPAKDPIYHHATYHIACVYALEGKSAEAVKWLRETAAWGLQPYPMLERDAYLNRIRQAPEFIQFMAEMKTRWESHRREFGEDAT